MKYYLGIDLGGTNIACGVVDENYNIISKHSVKTLPERGFEAVVKAMAEAAERTSQIAGLKMEDIEAVGMGVPCSINPKTNLLVHANNLGWKNVPLYDEMKKYIPKEVYIRNDADCAALGEVLAGAARGRNDAVMLTIGTGVGGGVVINNQLFSGCDLMGCEFGHTMFAFGGTPCNCGSSGCLEAYASATALIRMAREEMAEHRESLMNELCPVMNDVSGKTVFDAADMGDETATALLDRYMNYVAAGTSTFITIFRPEIVILGGGISSAGNRFIDPVRELIKKYTFAAKEAGVPEVVGAALGNDAGIIGAAMLKEHTDAPKQTSV